MNPLLLSTLLALSLAACDGGGPGGAGGQGGTGGVGGEGGTGGTGGVGGEGGGGGAGPVVRIHLRSSAAPFPHADGLSGQTPLAHASGMRSFQLFADPSDPTPVVVFDLGTGFVEVDYADGADTVVATVPASSLTAGTFTLGRVVHSHVRYRVAATMHAQGMSLPGEFDNLQVMSDGTLLDGALRDAGYYEYAFVAGAQSFPASGTDAPVPEYLGSGGFSVVVEGSEWAYYFPVSLVVDPGTATDVDVYMDVNMHESFRWQEQALPDYAAGVFDATPVAAEPVVRFGANSHAVSVE